LLAVYLGLEQRRLEGLVQRREQLRTQLNLRRTEYARLEAVRDSQFKSNKGCSLLVIQNSSQFSRQVDSIMEIIETDCKKIEMALSEHDHHFRKQLGKVKGLEYMLKKRADHIARHHNIIEQRQQDDASSLCCAGSDRLPQILNRR
jgi:flagellar biosynthesis chaperone FliJ